MAYGSKTWSGHRSGSGRLAISRIWRWPLPSRVGRLTLSAQPRCQTQGVTVECLRSLQRRTRHHSGVATAIRPLRAPDSHHAHTTIYPPSVANSATTTEPARPARGAKGEGLGGVPGD